jgi:Xaa-Pro aminopeptidase
VAGYPAIVGSGANGLVWHYNDNGARVEAGQTIVMDYGGSLDYQVIDITRTWPVSGSFDPEQRRAYECVLEAQKAIIAAMKPGATRAQTRDIARAIFEKRGFDAAHAGGAGHFVGMAVHDVGDPNLPFEPGMVIAVEPILQIKEKNLHVRIEDTVLITDGEPLVLTASAPKEVEALLALMARPGTR